MDMKTSRSFLALLLTLAGTTVASAQITVTPVIGGYLPATDVRTLKGDARQIGLERTATMAVGLNVELGSLRGSLAYVTGSSLSDTGVTNSGQIGDGSLLALAAGVVLRPLPRIVGLQPYVVGGGGVKRSGYSFRSSGYAVDFPESETDLAAHFGGGADFMLGRLGLVVEVTDFVTFKDSSFGPHDVFGTVGVRLRVF